MIADREPRPVRVSAERLADALLKDLQARVRDLYVEERATRERLAAVL
ncbi:MAG TPA: hypothetical protein VNO82_15820 [Solirubrobacteraceae bacterium]|nr:hypothetical protein [Solirubrobacteraceae bacterium]